MQACQPEAFQPHCHLVLCSRTVQRAGNPGARCQHREKGRLSAITSLRGMLRELLNLPLSSHTRLSTRLCSRAHSLDLRCARSCSSPVPTPSGALSLRSPRLLCLQLRLLPAPRRGGLLSPCAHVSRAHFHATRQCSKEE